MIFRLYLVRTPEAAPAHLWSALQAHISADDDHALPFYVTGVAAQEMSGAALDHAIRKALTPHLGSDRTQRLILSTGGHYLTALPLGSEELFPGMVILLSRPGQRVLAAETPALSLRVNRGPDAGRLIPLSRGSHSMGRGQCDIQLSDPAVSRDHAELEVGTREIFLRSGTKRLRTSVQAEQALTLGHTQCDVVLGPADPLSPQLWPQPPPVVNGDPPTGTHGTMLAFAAVPLIAGLVMVLVTGMWFFLLFSAAGAVIAGTLFFRSRRQRRKYRRAIEEAAGSWADMASHVFPSPGETARALHSLHSHVHISPVFRSAATPPDTAQEVVPIVSTGHGHLVAPVWPDSTGASKRWRNDSALTVTAPVAVPMTTGESTIISGSPRDALRLQRWILLQVLLNPSQPEILVHDPLRRGVDLPVHEDLSRVRTLADCTAVPTLPPGHSGVAISTSVLTASQIRAITEKGWHVLTVGESAATADGTPAAGPPGWIVDLHHRQVTRRDHPHAAAFGTTDSPAPPEGVPESAQNLQYDGISRTTLEQLLRLALRYCATAHDRGEVPATVTYSLPQRLCSDQAANALIADVGESAHGLEQVDLVADGPHMLIAGTSGSGKSELLKTILLSWSSRYGPDELSMVLVDFKGGATFHPFNRLEHVLGVVTDLSQAEAERTVESLRSELVRRERLFLQVGAGDYSEYRRLRPECPLPRMLVVIDEFRIFSHELPDQLDELMRLATLGRSLGLHLVLSTQRPQGVVTADIRANIGVTIALRMRSADESSDTIGVSHAAEISRKHPGRAILRRPGDPPVTLQGARLRAGTETLTVTSAHIPTDQSAHTSTTDVLDAIVSAVDQAGLRRPSTPLLPALPEHLTASERLSDQHVIEAKPHSGALMGRVDDPSSQEQWDLSLDVAQPRSWVLIGESSAGAQVALDHTVHQLLHGNLHCAVYLLDAERSLSRHANHQRCGGWLTEEDSAEASYLLEKLHHELTARKMSCGGDQEPMVVVMTGHSQWQSSGTRAGADIEHLMGVLASEGPDVGISVLISGGRELALGKLSSRVPHRIYLPYGSSEEVTYLWPTIRSTDSIPGRGVLLGPRVPPPGLTVQLVTSGVDIDCTEALSDESAPRIAVHPLPELITLEDVSSPDRWPAAPAQSDAGGVTVGISQFTGAPATLPLRGLTLILGSARTGKTTSLTTIKAQTAGAVVMRGGDTALPSSAEVLLIDDATQCTEGQHRLVEQALGAGVAVVATAPASSSIFSQLRWAHHARTQGTVVVLSPVSRAETEMIPATVPLLSRATPGRAVIMRDTGPSIVQWCTSAWESPTVSPP